MMKLCKSLLAVGLVFGAMPFAMDALPESYAQFAEGNLENQPGVDVQTRGPIHDARDWPRPGR